MNLKHTLALSVTASALALAGSALAETRADVTAETASAIASEVQIGAEIGQ